MEIKYDKIGIDYNRTRKADKYLSKRLFYHLKPVKNKLYIDIGCGTGNYTLELHKKGISVIGMDPSAKMISEAKKKSDQIDWRIGSAENTSLESNCIDGVMGFLTIHHWTNLQEGFFELNRILKDKGLTVIFTSTPAQMNGYWLNHYFPQMLKDSKKQMPSLSLIKDIMIKSGFKIIGTEKYFVHSDLEDHFLYSGKNSPELYLRKEIRNGISSFSDLANLREVENGLIKLKKEIDSGKINTIIKKFENDKGDYIFIIGEKVAFN